MDFFVSGGACAEASSHTLNNQERFVGCNCGVSHSTAEKLLEVANSPGACSTLIDLWGWKQLEACTSDGIG